MSLIRQLLESGGVEYGGEELTELPDNIPELVDFFKVTNSNITSLKGSPERVKSNVIILGNRKLTSLVGGPKQVGGFYYAHENDLRNLIGAPEECLRFTAHSNRRLTSLEGAPLRVEEDVRLNMNPMLHSLEGIGTKYLKTVGGTLTIGSHINSHALGLVLMKCSTFDLKFEGSEIILKYVGRHRFGEHYQQEAAIDCQHELIEAGYEDLAQL